ncbi:glycosyltransferase family 2 protein [Altibacter sp.]|uniref:glycosyltransferase family 2 protein n=1 Tax=Altibacter sp. TaxID=2024823 RepID=UPI000C9855F7|nr:glycosyltransferase family 2 protein [Altibacter sp.]MAP55560.1 capsular biosynthesis protein CpsI [Altibacter sp.]|tara:strand:+ start:15 stop:947 length:933 start_codon:yes stop_codon:yes gene_type:complete
MISVVIPLYNKEAYIAEAITSVLQQSYRDFQLIVIDDGSTDRSLEVASGFLDNRLTLISIPNQGVSVARNKGIGAASFEWIAFLDADDWWAPDFLKEIVKCIEAYPQHKLFASGRSHVFSDHVMRYDNPYLPEDGEVAILNYFKVISKYLPLINSSNAVISKTHLLACGCFKEQQKKHEDHDLWIRLSKGEDVVFSNRNLSFYRNSGSGGASKAYYHPSDFKLFLKTLLNTKQELSAKEKTYFVKYCNRFVLLTYIKNYGSYTRAQDREVYKVAKKLVTGWQKQLLWMLFLVPYKRTYPFFKLFKKRHGK